MNYFFEIRKVTNKKMKTQQRPKCSVPGCDRDAAHMLGRNHPRYPTYRKAEWIKELYPEAKDTWCCGTCHAKNTARVHGVKSAKHLTAKRQGISVTQYSHRNHPYLWARKNYCENIDGRLGFVCTYTGPNSTEITKMGLEDGFLGWLQVDHIDGNSENNNTDNLQTLCACCHSIKTIQNKDYATVGRKRLKELKNNRLNQK